MFSYPAISKSIIYVALVLLLSPISNAASQDSLYSKHTLKVAGGINNVWSNTDLPVYPDNMDCGKYSTGSKQGYYFDLNYGYDIFGSILTLIGGAIYEKRPVYLTTTSQCSEILDPQIDSYVPFTREHKYEGSLEYISLIAGIKSKPLDIIPVSLQVSADAGNPLINSKYTHTETILNQGITYPDGSRTKEIISGNINDAGTAVGISLSLLGDIPINNNWSLTPQITYRKSINSIVEGYDWNMDIFRAGVGVSYRFNTGKKTDVIPKQSPKDTIEKKIIITETEEEPFIESFEAKPLELRETVVTQTYPLLPYIFFDPSSSKLKDQYIMDSAPEEFSESELDKNTLGIYYNILNIIGSRMNQYPRSKIIVKGYTDGKENKNDLALNRALSVKDHLSSIWDIDPGRINTKAGNLPPMPTNTEYFEAFSENRRVEIYTEDMQLLRPVMHSKFMEYEPLQENIEFEITENKDQKANELNLQLLYDGLIISETSTFKTNDFNKIEIDDEIMNTINSSGTTIKDLSANLIVIHEDKLEKHSADINVDITKENYEIGRLNLIVFDFDRSDITPLNKAMLEDFIQNTISSNSIVEITGSTDRLGERQYNMELSRRRAESVSDYISKIMPDARIVKVKGIGNTELKYDNELPEGRFYCRTVLIEVKTPLDK